MKLTNEQVEAERVKFEIFAYEEYLAMAKRTEQANTLDKDILFATSERGAYARLNLNFAFKSWLVCRESIEIEVPTLIKENYSSHSTALNHNTSLLYFIEFIRSQGFTVATK